MAFTQADIDAVERAIASGELEVQFEDHKVRYRSIAELKTALRTMRQDMTQTRPRAVQVRTGKGL